MTQKIIALPVGSDRGLDSKVFPHFGRAPAFAIVEVDGSKIVSCRVLKNPAADIHGSTPMFVIETGANVILVSGIGPGAIDKLKSNGIEIATGASGTVKETIEAYLAGGLKDLTACEHDHTCSCQKR